MSKITINGVQVMEKTTPLEGDFFVCHEKLLWFTTDEETAVCMHSGIICKLEDFDNEDFTLIPNVTITYN